MSTVALTILEHFLTVVGVLLALFAFARLFSERRQPGNTFAWLLGIVLIPYVAVPLFLLFGGRKLRRLMKRKSRVLPAVAGVVACHSEATATPTAQTINSISTCPVIGCNELRLVATGEEAYAVLEQGIREAKHSIHITTFILGRDDTGRRLVRLLAERARAGVRVRLLLDAVGCLFSSRGFVDPIRHAGGEVAVFMPVLPFSSMRHSANLRNHRKLAIFDQHTAFLGGHNLAREYLGPTPLRKRWRDFGAVVSGPSATLLNDVFLADWSFATDQSMDQLRAEALPGAVRQEGDAEVQVVASGPDCAGDALYEGIISMVQEAERSIVIVTPYFIPDEVLFRSLIVKARAGCDVTLIVPEKSNHPVTDYARRHFVRELQSAGADVRLFGPGMMHSKAVIVDDRIGLLGSANLDLRSLFVNFEIGLFVYSRPEVLAMRSWAAGLLASSKPAPTRRRSLGFGQTVLEECCRLLAPLL
jgi:cardiolipin synthase